MRKIQQIANFIVHYSNDIEAPVSNLKLQKLLFFAWVEFYKSRRSYLFTDKFYAWQFGPVIPDIYYEYCVYGSLPITKYDLSEDLLNSYEKYIIKSVVERYKEKTALQLVKITHEDGHAWSKTYRNGFGNKFVIPFDRIIELEC